MSINASTNYMSSSSIEAWMETKTEDLYGSMRSAMGESNNRANAEQALNEIKADILNLQQNGGDVTELQKKLNDTLEQYKDVPELVTVLQPIANNINDRMGAASLAAASPPTLTVQAYNRSSGSATTISLPAPAANPQPVTIDKPTSDNWSSEIGNTVDGLGKQDQLGLINIQEFNSQINQTKQIASALMDAADKAANAIISHIS